MAEYENQEATKDSYIEGYSAWHDHNWGSYGGMQLSPSSLYKDSGVIEFDISDLPEYQGDLISATLWMYYYSKKSTTTNGRTVVCSRITRYDWVEMEVTWDNYKSGSTWSSPGGDYTTPTANMVVPGSYGWVSWDVLAHVEDAIADRADKVNMHLRFSPQNVATWQRINLYTREAGGEEGEYHPKLVIEYTPDVDIIEPSSIVSAEAFGTPTIQLFVQPSSIASGEAVGTPIVSLVPLGILPPSIASAEAFGTPNLKYNQIVSPSSIASAEAFGTPTVAPGPVSVTPSSIVSGEAFGTPFVYHYVGVTSHAVSACSYGSSVFLFRVGVDGHLYRRESSDNGDNWGSWVDMGDISGDADFRLACCFKDADEAIVLYSTGSTLYRRRLSSETWEAAAAWSNSLNSITGIAVTYMGDWNVAVTGTDTSDRPGVWTCILSDGYSGAPGTWYSLNELMIAEVGSGISYHFPTLDTPDVFRLFFIETYSETESYSMPYFTYSLPTADYIDNLWREPVPFNLSSEFGLGMAHVDGAVYLSCPYGLWSAEITPAPVDLSADLIGAHLSVKPLSGELELILRNDDGRYNAPDFTRGCDIRLKFGYHTTEGEETAGYLPMATIDSIKRTVKKGRSEVILHALDGWALLHNWKARYQYSWAAGDKNVFQILSFVFARAGIELSSYSTSSRITAYEPAFTIHPGERGLTAVKRLLSLVEDVIIFVGDTAYIIHPQSDDTADYAYGIDHKVTECSMFDSPLSINTALTHSEDIAVGDYRWSEINLVYDRLTKEYDDNIASAADAHLFGEAILRDAELDKVTGSIIVPMNVAHDLYDVVELTVPHLDIAAVLYRLVGIDFYWTPERGTYNQRLILSEV